MNWDKDDYLAAALIIGICILGILAILWITGNIPQSDDTGFPFGSLASLKMMPCIYVCKP